MIPWNTFVTTSSTTWRPWGPTWTPPIAGGASGRRSRGQFAAALALGYDKIFTDLRADNLDSLAYHLALGFTVVGAARRHARVDGGTSTSCSSSGS